MDVIDVTNCFVLSFKLQRWEKNEFLHRKNKPMLLQTKAYNPSMQKKKEIFLQ